MGDSHHFHHHHHQPRPKSQVFCDDDDDDLDFPERSSSSTGLIRHSETHHSVQSQSQVKSKTNKSELEQLRSRVCQMEKTMRWWSDCTSNWKQKWSQVRQERNALRAQLKEITGGSVAPKPEMKTVAIQTDQCEGHHHGMNNNAQSISTAADVHLLTKLLDEAQRTISIEREEKLHLHRSIERLQQDLVEFHAMYDELVKEVQLLKLDDNSKVSEEVDQEDEVGGGVVVVATVEDAAVQQRQQSQHQQQEPQVEDVELVETGVDGDDDEDDENEVDGDPDANSAAGVDSEEQDLILRCQGSGSNNGNSISSSNRMMVMSNSKSQQITCKPVITNDADHHTSL